MAVNAELGIDVADFNKGITSAKEQLKTFDAALRYAEASLNATGDAESAMTTKSEALRGKLEAQTKIVNQYTDALQKMNANGVDKTSAGYQKMQRDLLNAKAAMMNTKAQINGLNTSQQAASKSAEDLATNVGKIGKNVSLQTVADGVNKLTTSLERGARAAIRIGKNIARSAMDSTGYADDLTTRSTQYGIDVETLQRMEKVASYIDTDVDAIISARDRMSKNRSSLAELLGISTDGKSVDDVFWEAGEAIMNLGEGFDQNEYAMKIFGRGWRELLPLFTAGREEYEALMESQDVLTEDQVKSLAQADDAIKSIQQQIDLMKNQFWADNAENITGLLQWIVDNKESVVAALTAIATGFGLLKVGEFALNITKIVNGLRDLGILGGGDGGAPTVQPTGGTGGTGGGSGWLSGLGAGLKTAAVAAANDAVVISAAMLPAIIAQNQAYADSEAKRQARVSAVSGKSGANADFVRQAAELLTLRSDGTLFGTANTDWAAVENLLMGLSARQNQQKAELYNTLKDDKGTWSRLNNFWNGGEMDLFEINQLLSDVTDALAKSEGIKVKTTPEVTDDAASLISQQIGPVAVTVVPVMSGGAGATAGAGAASLGIAALLQQGGNGGHAFANGIPYVPSARLAWLHEGERVLTARDNRTYTANSNLYVERMIMNNGQDAAGLAAAMAAQNRRVSAGFGS